MVISPASFQETLMATYGLHSEPKDEEKTVLEASLGQISADLRALYEISPRLYDTAVEYTLESAASRLHSLTNAAIKLAFEIGQEASG
jgi:hypothetical protein